MAVRTRALREGALDLIKLSPQLYWAARTARMFAGSACWARSVPGIDGRVHFNDTMLGGTDPASVEVYTSGAAQFVGILDSALRSCGRSWKTIEACLDIGSGYGRVARALIQRFPPDRIWVSDLIDEAVRFCVEELGVNAAKPAGGGGLGTTKYDLIYLLSVISHTPPRRTAEILSDAILALKDEGILVFTTHGPISAQRCIDRYPMPWRRMGPHIVGALQADGVFFRNYRHYRHFLRDYGMAWYAPEFIMEMMRTAFPQVELQRHGPAELDGHQDVYIFRKRGGAVRDVVD